MPPAIAIIGALLGQPSTEIIVPGTFLCTSIEAAKSQALTRKRHPGCVTVPVYLAGTATPVRVVTNHLRGYAVTIVEFRNGRAVGYLMTRPRPVARGVDL